MALLDGLRWCRFVIVIIVYCRPGTGLARLEPARLISERRALPSGRRTASSARRTILRGTLFRSLVRTLHNRDSVLKSAKSFRRRTEAFWVTKSTTIVAHYFNR